MMFIRDRWFLGLAFLFGIVITLDTWLTSIGLKVGRDEGNPIVLMLIDYFGVSDALIITWFVTIALLLVCTYAYERLEYDRCDRLIYAVAIIVLCLRCIVIGFWMGSLICTAECMGAEQFVAMIRDGY